MTRLLLPTALLALTGCGPINFIAKLNGDATLQGSALGNLLSVFPQVSSFSNLDFDSNQDFKNNQTTRTHVKTMRATRFSLRISSPDTQDFDFLDSLEFYAAADGVPEQKVAGKSNIRSLNLAAPNPTLNLDLEQVDLAPFLRAPTMSLTVRGTGRQPPQDTTLRADAEFIVGVGL